jgi:hypothetical protein
MRKHLDNKIWIIFYDWKWNVRIAETHHLREIYFRFQFQIQQHMRKKVLEIHLLSFQQNLRYPICALVRIWTETRNSVGQAENQIHREPTVVTKDLWTMNAKRHN